MWEDILKADGRPSEEDNRDYGPKGTWLMEKRPNEAMIEAMKSTNYLRVLTSRGQATNKYELQDFYNISIQLDGNWGSISFASPHYFGLLTAFYNGWLKEQGEQEITDLKQLIMSARAVTEFVEYVKKYHNNGTWYSIVR